MHLYQAIGHLLRLIRTILPVVQSLFSSLCAGHLTPTFAPTLVHVAVACGRVLCPECHGENDGMFHFCQWCATPSTCYSISAEGARLPINETALGARYTQFTRSLENKTSTVRRETATTLLGQFLSSRTTGGAVGMATTQPRHIVQVLCWLDFCSNRRRTAYMLCTVHRWELRNFPVAQSNLENTQSGTHTILRGQTTFQNWPWRTSAISASPPTEAMLS